MVATLFNFLKGEATDTPAAKRVGSEKVLVDALFGEPLFGSEPIIYVPLIVDSNKPKEPSVQGPHRPADQDTVNFHSELMSQLPTARRG